MADAYAFNPDRSKAPVYTKEEIDQMDLVNDQAFAQEVADRQAAVSGEAAIRAAGDVALGGRIDNIIASAGDGTIPTELSDIRSGYDGTTHYVTAGAAVKAIDERSDVADSSIRDSLDIEFLGKTKITSNDFSGAYIDPDNYAHAGSALILKCWPVECGKTYRIFGRTRTFEATYKICSFGTNLFNGTDSCALQTVVIPGNTTIQEYDVVYTAQQDGYLYYSIAGGGNGVLLETQDVSFVSNGVLNELCDEMYRYVDQVVEDDNDNFYLDNSGYVKTSNSPFFTKSFEVEKGVPVRVEARIALNESLPAIGYSLMPLGDGHHFKVLEDGSVIPQDYSFTFVPPEDGYLYFAYNIEKIHNIYVSSITSSVRDDVDQSVYDSLKLADVVGENVLDLKYRRTDQIEKTVLEGYYLNNSGNLASIVNTNFVVMTFPVEAYKTYSIYGTSKIATDTYPLATFSLGGSASDYSFVDFIIEFDNNATRKEREVIFTPDRDGYVCTAAFTPASNGEIDTFDVVPYSPVLENANKGNLKIQVFGDSISDETWRADNTTWVKYLDDYLGDFNLTVVNSAVGGSGIGSGYSGGNVRYADRDKNHVHDLIAGYDEDNPSVLELDADVVIQFVGTNNWAGGGVSFGSFMDNYVSSFYGAARLNMEYVTTNTDALFIICTPCGRYNSTDQGRDTNQYGEPLNSQNKTLREYCDALVQTAHFFGCPVIDLNYDLGWNRLNVHNFCSDGLHPTAASSEIIARLIAGEIRKHLGY